MEQKFKLYHVLVSITIILICGLIALNYGWIAYATVAERAGLRGDLYRYYQLPRSLFYFYEGLVAASAFVLIILQLKSLIERNPKGLAKTFKAFLIFIGIVVICEIFLQARFVGKG